MKWLQITLKVMASGQMEVLPPAVPSLASLGMTGGRDKRATGQGGKGDKRATGQRRR